MRSTSWPLRTRWTGATSSACQSFSSAKIPTRSDMNSTGCAGQTSHPCTMPSLGTLMGRFSWVPYIMLRVCMSVCLSYETACRACSNICTYGAISRIRLAEEYQSVGNKQAEEQQPMLSSRAIIPSIWYLDRVISVPITYVNKIVIFEFDFLVQISFQGGRGIAQDAAGCRWKQRCLLWTKVRLRVRSWTRVIQPNTFEDVNNNLKHYLLRFRRRREKNPFLQATRLKITSPLFSYTETSWRFITSRKHAWLLKLIFFFFLSLSTWKDTAASWSSVSPCSTRRWAAARRTSSSCSSTTTTPTPSSVGSTWRTRRAHRRSGHRTAEITIGGSHRSSMATTTRVSRKMALRRSEVWPIPPHCLVGLNYMQEKWISKSS